MAQVITLAELERLKNIDFLAVDPAMLEDIQNVTVNTSLPDMDRAMDYLNQIKNPYCFRYENAVVKISFGDTELTLEDRLERFLQSL